MRISLLLAVSVALAGPAWGQSLSPLPIGPEDNYELGQRFANCSARFGLMAFVARRAGLTETATLAEGRARGWKVAGMFFLAEGLAPSRITETESTFDTLVEVKLMELKSRYELDPAALTAATPVEFARECEPLVPMQEKLIEVLRRGPETP